eukprot:7288769-Prymnesium_polylepis.1
MWEREARLPKNSARMPGCWLARAYRVLLLLLLGEYKRSYRIERCALRHDYHRTVVSRAVGFVCAVGSARGCYINIRGRVRAVDDYYMYAFTPSLVLAFGHRSSGIVLRILVPACIDRCPHSARGVNRF